MTTPRHPPCAALRARAAPGDIGAFVHAAWSADDDAWALLIAARSARPAPPQRTADVPFLVAPMLMSNVPSANRAHAAALHAPHVTAPKGRTALQRTALLTAIARRPDATAALGRSGGG
ncbi:MAG: hypothetical protein NZ701_09975 [Roseiflexus sp.]|nr:hypothetical protein [Roseiflexus sp.]